MSALETLISVLEPWNSLYSGSSTLSVALTFAHVAAMMVGGGLAIGADRAVLRAARTVTEQDRVHLADTIGDVHRPVVTALAISAVSGLLMALADLESFAGNRIFWIKMGLLVALAVNGWMMLRDERRVRADAGNRDAFSRLRVRAMSSVALWLAITLAGVGLLQGL